MDGLTFTGFIVGCILMFAYILIRRNVRDAASSVMLLISSMGFFAGLKIIFFAVSNKELAALAKAEGVEVWTIGLAGVSLMVFAGIEVFVAFFKPTE